MRNNYLFVFVVLLVFSTCFNRGQKIKADNRRSRGLVQAPRVGRNSDTVSLSRPDRSFGIIILPRNGRSIPGNLNEFYDSSPDADFEPHSAHDANPGVLLDPDYEEYMNRLMAFKHSDKIQKDGSWLMPDHMFAYKDFRSTRQSDNPRSYHSVSRNFRNIHGEYTPRLGRENERDATDVL